MCTLEIIAILAILALTALDTAILLVAVTSALNGDKESAKK